MRAQETKERRRNRSKSSLGRPTCLATLPALVALAVSAPLAGQQGRNLLAWEEPLQIRGEQVFVYGADDISLVHATASEPTRVASAATTEYKYDDGETNTSSVLQTSAGDVHEQEFAQRFRLTGSGTASYVELCVARRQDVGTSNRLPFEFTFYRDSGGRPGSVIGEYGGSVASPASGSARCFRFEGDIARQQLSGGDAWIGVSWQSSTGMAMMVDSSAVGNTKLSVRARVTSGSDWIAW